jgi:hypothetical protein
VALGKRSAAHRLLHDGAHAAPVAAEAGEARFTQGLLLETDGHPALFFALASGALFITVVAVVGVTTASHATLAGLPLRPCALEALQRLV